MKQAPDIKPDPVTMYFRHEPETNHPRLAVLCFAVVIALVWITPYLLHLDLPTWTDFPLVLTAIVSGAVALVAGVTCLVGW